MSFEIAQDYFIGKLYETASRIKYNSSKNEYNCGCPLCFEGRLRGVGRRFYYYGNSRKFHCFLCGFHGNEYTYLEKICNITWKDLKKDENAVNISFTQLTKEIVERNKNKNYDLPDDAINLCDLRQVTYHKRKNIIKIAISYIFNRRLYTAKYRPKSFWLSFNDPVQKNRLIIPFYDSLGKIPFYQSRKLIEEGNPAKYISKYESEKTLFNLDKVDDELEYIFLLEGPIDACFIKNAIGITGLIMTDSQKEQLKPYFLHDKIWVLDNQWKDNASKEKTLQLIEIGEKVFIWPEELKQYKDINDYCIDYKVDEFDYKKILDNSYQGLKAKLMLAKIK